MSPSPQTASKEERSLVYFLWKHDWTVARIAATMGKSLAAISQILREPMPLSAQIYLPPRASIVAQLRVRLIDDGQTMQIWLPADYLTVPTALLLSAIRETCSRLHIDVSLSHEELSERMRVWVYGTWLTVLEATPAQPASPGEVLVLVPVKVEALYSRVEIVPVRAGEVLARVVPGVAGTPGCDLLGRPIAAGDPPLPQFLHGDNTVISADGTELRAAVDGQVKLRKGCLSVFPQAVHEGDLTGVDERLIVQGGMIVTGSVREHSELIADGEVHVLGGIYDAQVGSVRRSIIVNEAVRGSSGHPAVLHAGNHIICGGVAHADLHACGDIRVDGTINQSKLTIGGDLFLPAPLDRSLVNVELALEGGIFVPVETFAPVPTLPPVRRQVRVASTIAGFLAPYDKPPMDFSPVVLTNLSVDGARCRFRHRVTAAQTSKTTIQLKFKLPDHAGDVVVIGRLVGVELPLEVRVRFTQITQRDVQRIARYCTN